MSVISLANRRRKSNPEGRIVTVELMSHIYAQGTLIAMLDTGRAMIDIGGGKRATGKLLSQL